MVTKIRSSDSDIIFYIQKKNYYNKYLKAQITSKLVQYFYFFMSQQLLTSLQNHPYNSTTNNKKNDNYNPNTQIFFLCFLLKFYSLTHLFISIFNILIYLFQIISDLIQSVFLIFLYHLSYIIHDTMYLFVLCLKTFQQLCSLFLVFDLHAQFLLVESILVYGVAELLLSDLFFGLSSHALRFPILFVFEKNRSKRSTITKQILDNLIIPLNLSTRGCAKFLQLIFADRVSMFLPQLLKQPFKLLYFGLLKVKSTSMNFYYYLIALRMSPVMSLYLCLWRLLFLFFRTFILLQTSSIFFLYYFELFFPPISKFSLSSSFMINRLFIISQNKMRNQAFQRKITQIRSSFLPSINKASSISVEKIQNLQKDLVDLRKNSIVKSQSRSRYILLNKLKRINSEKSKIMYCPINKMQPKKPYFDLINITEELKKMKNNNDIVNKQPQKRLKKKNHFSTYLDDTISKNIELRHKVQRIKTIENIETKNMDIEMRHFSQKNRLDSSKSIKKIKQKMKTLQSGIVNKQPTITNRQPMNFSPWRFAEREGFTIYPSS